MNVLVIMCDHHRYDALGCLGNRLAHTPNLDRLAAESVRFSQCYNQSPVCAPERHSLATGQYARLEAWEQANAPAGAPELRPVTRAKK